MRKLIAAGLLTLSLAACGGKHHQAAAPETNTITGTFSLIGSSDVGTEAEDPYTPNETFTTDKDNGVPGNGCYGSNGYDDVAAGLQVNVSNEAGTLLGTTQLGTGEFEEGEFSNNCNFTFSVPDVPVAKFYKVAVGQRGEQSISFDQMQKNGWHVLLTLG